MAAEHIQEPRHKTVVRARKARRAGCRWILRPSFVGLNSLNKKLEGNIKKISKYTEKALEGCMVVGRCGESERKLLTSHSQARHRSSQRC